MSVCIDSIVVDFLEGRPLSEGHHAKVFAAGLPAWHPVRRLFSGESQWLGRNDAVYLVLRLFCELYGDRVRPSDGGEVLDASAEFLRVIPNDVLYRGRRYKIHRLHARTRRSIEAASAGSPTVRAAALEAFDRTLALLVRAVSQS